MLFKDFLQPEIDIIEDIKVVTHEDVKLCFLSFVKPTLAEMKFGVSFDTYSDAFNKYLETVTDKEHTVLITHQSFENCTTGKSEAMTFFDDAILLKDVADFPLTLAAHIHKKQKVGDNVYYCGSLLPYAFGDSYSYDVRVWDIQPDGTYAYEDYPINILHDLQVIKGSLQHCLAQEDTGAFVKIELIDETLTPEFALTELKTHFKNLVTVSNGIKDTWEADLNKPMEQFASFTEAIDSFCQQIEIPEFNAEQKALIEEVIHEVTNS
jgi:DNA repair exonuclease SbcCD nuclease subunit